MKCVFDKCYDAVKCANDNKSFGFYYSEKQNPDLNIHIHDCCEVLLCMEGGKSFLINDKVYDVNNGDIFIINQFEAHMQVGCAAVVSLLILVINLLIKGIVLFCQKRFFDRKPSKTV